MVAMTCSLDTDGSALSSFNTTESKSTMSGYQEDGNPGITRPISTVSSMSISVTTCSEDRDNSDSESDTESDDSSSYEPVGMERGNYSRRRLNSAGTDTDDSSASSDPESVEDRDEVSSTSSPAYHNSRFSLYMGPGTDPSHAYSDLYGGSSDSGDGTSTSKTTEETSDQSEEREDDVGDDGIDSNGWGDDSVKQAFRQGIIVVKRQTVAHNTNRTTTTGIMGTHHRRTKSEVDNHSPASEFGDETSLQVLHSDDESRCSASVSTCVSDASNKTIILEDDDVYEVVHRFLDEVESDDEFVAKDELNFEEDIEKEDEVREKDDKLARSAAGTKMDIETERSLHAKAACVTNDHIDRDGAKGDARHDNETKRDVETEGKIDGAEAVRRHECDEPREMEQSDSRSQGRRLIRALSKRSAALSIASSVLRKKSCALQRTSSALKKQSSALGNSYTQEQRMPSNNLVNPPSTQDDFVLSKHLKSNDEDTRFDGFMDRKHQESDTTPRINNTNNALKEAQIARNDGVSSIEESSAEKQSSACTETSEEASLEEQYSSTSESSTETFDTKSHHCHFEGIDDLSNFVDSDHNVYKEMVLSAYRKKISVAAKVLPSFDGHTRKSSARREPHLQFVSHTLDDDDYTTASIETPRLLPCSINYQSDLGYGGDLANELLFTTSPKQRPKKKRNAHDPTFSFDNYLTSARDTRKNNIKSLGSIISQTSGFATASIVPVQDGESVELHIEDDSNDDGRVEVGVESSLEVHEGFVDNKDDLVGNSEQKVLGKTRQEEHGSKQEGISMQVGENTSYDNISLQNIHAVEAQHTEDQYEERLQHIFDLTPKNTIGTYSYSKDVAAQLLSIKERTQKIKLSKKQRAKMKVIAKRLSPKKLVNRASTAITRHRFWLPQEDKASKFIPCSNTGSTGLVSHDTSEATNGEETVCEVSGMRNTRTENSADVMLLESAASELLEALRELDNVVHDHAHARTKALIHARKGVALISSLLHENDASMIDTDAFVAKDFPGKGWI